jgi:asparagine synthase (glutamine-hydrolysing)
MRRNLTDCILLSGGLYTSIISAVAIKLRRLTGVTVSLGEAPDVRFASLIAERFGLRHHVVRVENTDVEETIPEVVRVMQSFDPMKIRNDATIMMGLRYAKAAGFNAVMTGDAGDELFAGYSFFFNMSHDILDKRLREMWSTMQSCSQKIWE